MSWTEIDDRNRIKEVADKLHSKNIAMVKPAGVFCQIGKYGFETPLDLQNELAKMWDTLEKSEMKAFSNIVMAVSFKNRDVEVKEEVSPFNYEF